MSLQRGPGSGLSGAINVPGVGAKFEVQILRFQPRMAGATRPRRGRGGGVYRTVRWIMSAGTGVCSGKPRLDGWPAPDAWKGQAGTLTVQVATGKTVAYPVLITEMGFKHDEKTGDVPDVFFAWEITGEPDYVGWAATTQPAATDAAKADQIQWEQSSKTFDPNGLQENAVVFIDLHGDLADTDAAETDKLVAVVMAAVAPMTGQKKRTATYRRDAIDGGTIEILFGLTDTAEDVINPATQTTVDPQGLDSNATAAAINGTPDTPSGDLFVVRGTRTDELNDAKVKTTRMYGLRSTQADRENPGTFTNLDPSDLESVGRQTKVYDSAGAAPAASVPSGLQKVNTHTETENPQKNVVIYEFAKDTSRQKAEQQRSFTEIDPQGLATRKAAAQQDGTPATPAGTVERSTKVESLTHDHTITTVEGGMRTTADDETFAKTRVETDASALSQTDFIPVLFTTGSSPTPPARVGMVVADYFDAPVTNPATTNQSVRIYRMSFVSNTQRITLPKLEIVTDPNDLDSFKRFAVIWDATGSPPSDPALPSGLKLRTKTDYGLDSTAKYQVRVYHWTINDTKDEIEKGGTWAEGESFGGKKFQTASQVPTIDAASTTMASLFLSLKSDARFRRVRVRQINDRQSEAIVETQTAEIIITGTCESYTERMTLSYIEGGEIYVYLREVIQSGSNLWQYQLAEQPRDGSRIRFSIERLVSGTELPLRRDLLRTTNASAFLGIDPYYCRYLGSGFALNYSIPAPRVSQMRYEFLMDELGFVSLEDVSSGWGATTTTLRTIDARHWVRASDIGLAPTTLPTGDYSGFLA